MASWDQLGSDSSAYTHTRVPEQTTYKRIMLSWFESNLLDISAACHCPDPWRFPGLCQRIAQLVHASTVDDSVLQLCMYVRTYACTYLRIYVCTSMYASLRLQQRRQVRVAAEAVWKRWLRFLSFNKSRRHCFPMPTVFFIKILSKERYRKEVIGYALDISSQSSTAPIFWRTVLPK